MDLIKVNISSLEQSISLLKTLEGKIPSISGISIQGKGEVIDEIKAVISDLNDLGSAFKQTVSVTSQALSNAKAGFLAADEKTAREIKSVSK